MNILFVRHGESQNNLIEKNLEYEKIRDIDPDLTENGINQCIKVGKYLN